MQTIDQVSHLEHERGSRPRSSRGGEADQVADGKDESRLSSRQTSSWVPSSQRIPWQPAQGPWEGEQEHWSGSELQSCQTHPTASPQTIWQLSKHTSQRLYTAAPTTHTTASERSKSSCSSSRTSQTCAGHQRELKCDVQGWGGSQVYHLNMCKASGGQISHHPDSQPLCVACQAEEKPVGSSWGVPATRERTTRTR